MPKFKITDDQGQVHRVEAADVESAKKLFLSGGSPVAPQIKPKGDPLTGPAFIKPDPVFPNPPAGETAISAPKGQGIPSDQNILQAVAGEPGQSPINRIMTAVGNLLPTPATGAGVAAGAIPNKLLPFGAGRVGQVLQRTGAGAGLGALTGLGKALVTGEEVAPEMAVGVLGGGVGGLAAGATKAPLMPNKATQRAQAGAQELANDPTRSANVRGQIDPKDPASMYSAQTIRSSKKAASGNFQSEIDALDKLFPNGVPVPRAHLLIPGRPKPGIAPSMPVGDVQRSIAKLRQEAKADPNKKVLAHYIEQDLITALGPHGPRYEAARNQFADNMTHVRFLQGLQKRDELIGKVNPKDNPAIARAEQALGPTKGGSAAYHTGMFVAHPTSPYGVAHGVEAAGNLAGKGAVQSHQIAPIGPLRAGAGYVFPPIAGGLAGSQVQGIFGLGSTE